MLPGTQQTTAGCWCGCSLAAASTAMASRAACAGWAVFAAAGASAAALAATAASTASAAAPARPLECACLMPNPVDNPKLGCHHAPNLLHLSTVTLLSAGIQGDVQSSGPRRDICGRPCCSLPSPCDIPDVVRPPMPPQCTSFLCRRGRVIAGATFCPAYSSTLSATGSGGAGS